MTENSAEGRNTTTTTTVLDGKNGSVHKSSAKLTKSVSEDLKTTFRSPVAWLLVAALVVTWTAVAIVMFDLVDYKSLAGGSLNKFRNEPVKVIHEVVDDTTDWLYAIFSTMSDIIALDDDQKGHVQPPVKKIVGIQPHVHTKAFQKDKEEKHEHLDVKVTKKVFHKEKPVKEEKITHKIIHKEKPEAKEKPEKKLPAKVVKKEKPETHEKPGKKAPSKVSEKQKPEPKTKSEKKVPAKVTAKEKTEKKEKAEKKETPKAEKKIKISQVEEKPKKEVKAKTSEAKSTKDIKKESKAAEEKKIKLKTKETTPEKPEEKQDQYQFCRYVVDMYALGNYSTVQKEAETSRAPPRKAAATPSPSIKAEELKKKPSEKKKDALAPKKAAATEERKETVTEKKKEVSEPKTAEPKKERSSSEVTMKSEKVQIPAIKEEKKLVKAHEPKEETAKTAQAKAKTEEKKEDKPSKFIKEKKIQTEKVEKAASAVLAKTVKEKVPEADMSKAKPSTVAPKHKKETDIPRVKPSAVSIKEAKPQKLGKTKAEKDRDESVSLQKKDGMSKKGEKVIKATKQEPEKTKDSKPASAIKEKESTKQKEKPAASKKPETAHKLSAADAEGNETGSRPENSQGLLMVGNDGLSGDAYGLQESWTENIRLDIEDGVPGVERFNARGEETRTEKGQQLRTNTDPRATGFQNTEKVTAASQGVQSAVTQDPSTGVKIVWVMGHSFIYWANVEASKKMGGLQLGCPVDQWEVKWFGIRGMCWELLFPLFLDYGRMFPRPHVLIVHLGGNDLGMIPQKELVRRIKRDLGNIKDLYPGIKIIWSQITPRLVWRSARDYDRLEKSRKKINKIVSSFVKRLGGGVVFHPDFEVDGAEEFYLKDGVHFNQFGLQLFLFDVKEALGKILGLAGLGCSVSPVGGGGASSQTNMVCNMAK